MELLESVSALESGGLEELDLCLAGNDDAEGTRGQAHRDFQLLTGVKV
jgi:hypothetical protein